MKPAAKPAKPVADGPVLSKVKTATAAEICKNYEPGKEAAKLLDPAVVPAIFLDQLLAAGLLQDALTFLSYALPRREAIWWGLWCARHTAPPEPEPPIVAAFTTIEAWTSDPTEERRRAAMPAAEAATYGTPAGCMALAVFFSGGSMAPPDCPKVPPGEWLCARTVDAAVTLTTLLVEPPKMVDTALAFATRGIEVANEQAPWEKKK